MERKYLSAAKIPPPDSPEMQDGSLIRTLFNTGEEENIAHTAQGIFCSLQVHDEGNDRFFVPLGGKYCIGRGKIADIQLNEKDLSISRKHAIPIIEKSGISLKMIGNNGGRVNKEPVLSGTECFVRRLEI